MQEVEIVLGLLVAVTALVIISRKQKIPYPVMLVLGGAILALMPGLPKITLKPEIVFLLFMPPLLYWESLTASLRDLQRNARSISLLAIGLVLVSTLLVGWVAHQLMGISWGAAFVLGAILAPTDEAAVTEVSALLTIPRRLLTILEGESLVNDAVSLVAYRMAIAALVTGAFSLREASLQFVIVSIGGVGVGLAVGWGVAYIRKHIPSDPPVETTISLLTPFAAYMPADALGVSGVLAVITTGLYLGRVGPRLVCPETRLQTGAFWGMVTFLLNGLLFILTGMQLQEILHSRTGPTLSIVGYAALILLTLIVVRMAWVVFNIYLPHWLNRRVNKKDPRVLQKATFLVGWVGMRGGLSLAAALAVPITLSNGQPFPGRDEIISISYLVILATLLLQGLSLPWLIRRLKLKDDGVEETEETQARLAAVQASLTRLERALTDHRAELQQMEPKEVEAHAPLTHILEDLHEHHVLRAKHLTAKASGALTEKHVRKKDALIRLRRELLEEERETVIRMRDRGEISNDVMLRIQYELDLEEIHLGDPTFEEE